jgi:hypothetical protein
MVCSCGEPGRCCGGGFGESYVSTAYDPTITALDLSGTYARRGQSATITSLYDYDRDGDIDDADLDLAHDNLNKSIVLLIAPA